MPCITVHTIFLLDYKLPEVSCSSTQFSAIPTAETLTGANAYVKLNNGGNLKNMSALYSVLISDSEDILEESNEYPWVLFFLYKMWT